MMICVNKEVCEFISVHVLKLKHCTYEVNAVKITNFNSGAESF